MKKTVRTIVSLVALALLVALLLGVVKLSNGFKTDIKTFYIKVDGTMVTERGSFRLDNNRFEVCDLVNKVTGETTEYTYEVVVNENVDMPTFVVDGKKVSFADVKDLTSLFEFQPTDNGFVMKTTTLKTMLKTLYNAETIIFPSDIDSKAELFSLVITSGDKSIVCDFSVPLGIIASITLDKTEIVF